MAALDDKIRALRERRADFSGEVVWHKFLLDAAFGIGGFRGRVGPTAIATLGWAADAYASVLSAISSPAVVNIDGRETYLDQFPREDAQKFSRRIDVSHYTNYVGPIHDTLISYLNKEKPNRDKVPDELNEWMEDSVAASNKSWDDLLDEVIKPRASLLGWCPVLFDFPPMAIVPRSKAEERELGRKPLATPLFPVNVLDWGVDEQGVISSVKLCTKHETRPDGLLGKKVYEERYSLWYRDKVERYTVRRLDKTAAEEISSETVTEHGLGRIPLVIFRAKPTSEDSVRGVSSIGNSAVAARRLFNLESEMDDHIRGQVFAVMGVPVQSTDTDIGEIVGGNSNGIKVPATSRQGVHFAAPPASVAATLEKRMEVMVREIYRTENVEHVKATGTTATSGIARAYEFNQTNRRLSDMAASFARAEEEALKLVGGMMLANGSEELTVTAPDDFSVEDLASEIAAVLEASGLDLGPTADTEMRRRLVRRIVPNLPSSVAEQIDDELEKRRNRLLQDEAMGGELDSAGDTGIQDGSGEDGLG